MGMTAQCDGCHKREKAVEGSGGQWQKPTAWYQRSDEDGIQIACSRRCIDLVARRTGKTNAGLPI